MENCIDAKIEKPELGKIVKVIYESGESAVGYFYDNYYRSGWMTNKGDGLFSNHAWGGDFVKYWIKE